MFSGLPLEVFGSLPLGLTVPSINDDWSADGKAGFTLGFGAGVSYFFTGKLGFGGELLYLKHWIGWDSRVVRPPFSEAGITVDRVTGTKALESWLIDGLERH